MKYYISRQFCGEGGLAYFSNLFIFPNILLYWSFILMTKTFYIYINAIAQNTIEPTQTSIFLKQLSSVCILPMF